VVPRGLAPRTLRLLAVRSNQLCYETAAEQSAMVSVYYFEHLCGFGFLDFTHNT
jgi:hypothetical protein